MFSRINPSVSCNIELELAALWLLIMTSLNWKADAAFACGGSGNVYLTKAIVHSADSSLSLSSVHSEEDFRLCSWRHFKASVDMNHVLKLVLVVIVHQRLNGPLKANTSVALFTHCLSLTFLYYVTKTSFWQTKPKYTQQIICFAITNIVFYTRLPLMRCRALKPFDIFFVFYVVTSSISGNLWKALHL